MQLWRLENSKPAEPMSQLESEGWAAAVKAGKAEVPFESHQAGEFSLTQGRVSLFSIQAFS